MLTIAKSGIAPAMKDLLKGAIFVGLLFFVVNSVAIVVFNLTGLTLVAVNILPTIGAILLILHAFDKI